MTARLILENPCEHGETLSHVLSWTYNNTIDEECPGGTRRELDSEPIGWCVTHSCSLSGRGGICLKRLAKGRPKQMEAYVLVNRLIVDDE